MDAMSVHELALTHLSVNAANETGGAKLLHVGGMEQLAPVLLHLEEVDLSGQHEIGADGWTALVNGVRVAHDKLPANANAKLKGLVLAKCRIKGESKNMLEDMASKFLPGLIIDFGTDDAKKKRLCVCC